MPSQLFSFAWLPEYQTQKQSAESRHLTTSLCKREKEGQGRGRDKLRSNGRLLEREAQVSSSLPLWSFLLEPLICNNWENNSVVLKTQIWAALFGMLPAGLLISRVKNRRNERCWTNLLQVRLSVSCYATQQGGFTICRSWVGSNWIWKLRSEWIIEVGVGGNNHVCLWCIYL